MNKIQSPKSWNNIPAIDNPHVYTLEKGAFPPSVPHPYLAYGNGRSYGDVCLNQRGSLLKTHALDKLIHFDPEKGILRAQAGILLRDILEFTIPQGWFLNVVPGTSLASLGGAVANDVHGKNHHCHGSFGHHVRRLLLLRTDLGLLECHHEQHQDLFYATIGGLGLTGLIVEVEVQLKRIANPFIWCEQHAFHSLDDYWQLNEIYQKQWPYSVSWIDCLSHKGRLGRGIMFLGKAAAAQDKLPRIKSPQYTFPIKPPISLVNKVSLWLFNQMYFNLHRHQKAFLSDYRRFYFPLDGIYHWNRMYGKQGFYQYQCVLPPHNEKEGIKALLQEIQRSQQGSFLAVLKTFGDIPSLGLLSFPRSGTTLALDFPNQGERTLQLFHRLDAIVHEAKGALYPAKDARMPRELFIASYPKLNDFIKMIDPQFSSHFWERLTT